MATLYIHIGTHKTGTTTLQNFLYTNRKQLAAQNVIYPEAGLDKGLKGHHPIAFKLANRKSLMGQDLAHIDIEDTFRILRGLLHEGRNVLLSSEDFSGLSLAQCPTLPLRIAELFPEATSFRIIIYLRRQDEFLSSYYAQQRKGERLRTRKINRRYVRTNRYFPYSSLLKRWENVFGLESMNVRPFEKESLVDGDLIADLCKQIGVSGLSGSRVKTNHFNLALTERKLQAIDYIRDVVKGPTRAVVAFSRQFVDRYAERLRLDQGGTNFVAPELAREILAMSARDNVEIAQRYLGREQLFLNLAISDTYQSPQALTAAELGEIEALVVKDIARFNQEAEVSGSGVHATPLEQLKMRSRLARRQVRIGALRVSIGGFLRKLRFLSRRLAQ